MSGESRAASETVDVEVLADREQLMTVASKSSDETDVVDVGRLVDVEALANRGWSTVVARMLLDEEDVVDTSGLVVVTRLLVVETVIAEGEDGENRLDGLSIQEETTSETKKSKDIAVPTYR